MTNAENLPTSTAPALIVLGRDDAGKAHASWFGEADAPLATKAAEIMGMAALGVATDELREFAGQLPPGRVFASGRAFVPFVKASLFDAIAGHLPAGFSFPEKQPEQPKPRAGKKKAGAKDDAGETVPKRPKPKPAVDWSSIDVGSLVLATEGYAEGWFEAQVVQIKGDGLYVLRWRDWIDWPVFVRRDIHIALIHPDHTE